MQRLADVASRVGTIRMLVKETAPGREKQQRSASH
jgi:hypothetical protein